MNYLGSAKQIAAYATGGGGEPDHFQLGYAEAGRFGTANAARYSTWSSDQVAAYNAGVAASMADKKAFRAPAP